MKLLLTSSGINNSELEQAFSELTGNRKGLKMVIIHTASDPINWVPETPGSKKFIAKIDESKIEKNKKWLESYAKNFTDKGYRVTLIDLKTDSDEIREKLQNVDVIDVTGGDVNYLLDWAKKAKLGDYLKNLLDRGVVYIGASAGNGLVMPDIGLTWWEPASSTDGPTDTEDHVGFGIVDFVLVPHQKETDERSNEANLIKRKKYLQSLISFPWKVYLLQDGQAVKVNGDKIEYIGQGVKKFI